MLRGPGRGRGATWLVLAPLATHKKQVVVAPLSGAQSGGRGGEVSASQPTERPLFFYAWWVWVARWGEVAERRSPV